MITKTDFIRYLECPLYAWLWKNRSDLRDDTYDPKVAEQGEEIEQIALKLFEEGKKAEGNYQTAEKNTKKLMSDNSVSVIYQATALTDKYLARADILKKDKFGEWHLFEVKSSTEKKPDHIADLSFQFHTFSKAGINLKTVNLILINSKYVYRESKGLEIDKFLKVEDVTEEIKRKVDGFVTYMEIANRILMDKDEPRVVSKRKHFKHPVPKKFEEYYKKDIPEYSIYDINNIRKNNLVRLSQMGIELIKNIPDNFFKSDAQNLQVKITKLKTDFILEDDIKLELEKLEYPLYFLDYETINPTIPFLDGTTPYQQIPFQYSLHIIDKKGAKPKHFDFLHSEKTDPMLPLLKSLKEKIGDKGSIIVWNDVFEKGRNIEMGKLFPEYSDFMESVNSRVYDLMKIFKKKYQDYRFKGSASIKNVLPVLAPELSYKELEIQHGVMAMDNILELIEHKVEDREKTIKDLKTYCKMDTFAMVRVFEFLLSL